MNDKSSGCENTQKTLPPTPTEEKKSLPSFLASLFLWVGLSLIFSRGIVGFLNDALPSSATTATAIDYRLNTFDSALVCNTRDDCSALVTPKEIKLRFLSKEDYNSERGKTASSNALAFTYLNRYPCEIVMPAEGRIQANSLTGYALFGYDTELGMHLAHEILHCMVGNWHTTNVSQLWFNQYYDRPFLKDSKFMEGLANEELINKLPLVKLHPWEHLTVEALARGYGYRDNYGLGKSVQLSPITVNRKSPLLSANRGL